MKVENDMDISAVCSDILQTVFFVMCVESNLISLNVALLMPNI